MAYVIAPFSLPAASMDKLRAILATDPEVAAVSTHLYRIYPKLGISARSQLAAALSETP